MWRSGSDDPGGTVVCIACGSTVASARAREYDKEGDRWDREDKEFEYLCKECHRNLCHQPREELESLLVDLDAGEAATDDFLAWYCAAVEERYGPLEEEN